MTGSRALCTFGRKNVVFVMINQLENCQARYHSNTWMGRTRTDGPDEFEPSKFDCICALWSPAGKGLTSWLSFVVSTVSLSLSYWYPGSGVVLDCIDS